MQFLIILGFIGIIFIIIKNNKKRKTYHNYYSKEKWGDSRYYDLIISTSKVGIDGAFDVVSNYVKKVIDE